ncbi:MAG: transposase [Aliishimia sp.]
MAIYTRYKQPGGTYFFTARLHDPSSDLLIREVGHLRAATRATKARYPFSIDAIVILPSAIHTIWTLPEGDADYSTRWSMLKALFSKGLPLPENRTQTQIKRNEKGIWQRRFWEHLIRDEDDFATHMSYVHQSPVQMGLVAQASQWQHSSIHRNATKTQSRPLPNCSNAAPQAQLTGLNLPRVQPPKRTTPLSLR